MQTCDHPGGPVTDALSLLNRHTETVLRSAAELVLPDGFGVRIRGLGRPDHPVR